MRDLIETVLTIAGFALVAFHLLFWIVLLPLAALYTIWRLLELL